ncbi:MAG: hypothetical protein HY814_04220, partial [Candidatus Riflebacteria bacterium]|nr:hypothetical protein [Candidatus Riflebacteria bacterium]
MEPLASRRSTGVPGPGSERNPRDGGPPQAVELEQMPRAIALAFWRLDRELWWLSRGLDATGPDEGPDGGHVITSVGLVLQLALEAGLAVTRYLALIALAQTLDLRLNASRRQAQMCAEFLGTERRSDGHWL